MTVATGVRRVATYERVSSEDQRERETIKTQTDEIARLLAGQSGVELVGRYADDGVSGTTPLAERPDGRRLLADAEAGVFDEVWVYKFDRLGRDTPDQTAIGRWFKRRGIRLISRLEGEPDLLTWDILAAISDNDRRMFLRRTADGMSRAAREGRYTGGIAPFGYRADGVKASARLVPDKTIVWADKSAADLVRDIFERLARQTQSCRMIARDFNALGIPTHYARDGRGVRGKTTQGLWRSGRIRNLVVNPVYRGELQYGRRIDQRGAKTERVGHEIISAAIEGLVSPALWRSAQDALAANRRIAKNTHRVYLLKGAMTCGVCGLRYVGSWSNKVGWYRCGGQLVERGPIPGRCLGTSVRNDAIELPVWDDIEAWLRNPGDVLDALDGASEREAQGAIAEAEGITLSRALVALEAQRKQSIALNIRGRLSDADLDAELDRIDAERTELQARLAAVQAPRAEVVPQKVHDLLAEIRARLDAGLSDEQRQQITRLLASGVIHTSVDENGKKTAKAVVTYRFPCVVNTFTATGSWRRSTGIATERRPLAPLERLPPGRPRVAGAAIPGLPCRTPEARPRRESRRGPRSPHPATDAARPQPLPRTRSCGAATGTGVSSPAPVLAQPLRRRR
ncbi:MAG TPA: recombinase family protein [Terriglobales bacterium]|nr:recombinase family protein [Terriglobales bacterium]